MSYMPSLIWNEMRANSSLGVIHSALPTTSITESLALIHKTTPRPWIARRKMFPHFHTGFLHTVLDLLLAALTCTDKVLNHPSTKPLWIHTGQTLVEWRCCNFVHTRRLVISMLRNKVLAFFLGLASPNTKREIKETSGNVRITSSDAGNVPEQTSLVKKKLLGNAFVSYIPSMCTLFQLDIHGRPIHNELRNLNWSLYSKLLNNLLMLPVQVIVTRSSLQ